MFAPLGVILILLVVWIFEPLNVTEALGEYLISTTVETVPIECSQANEPPPAALMEVIDAQTAFYHLTLQTVSVCRSQSQNLAREVSSIL